MPLRYGGLSKSSGGGESARGTECPVEFTMVETFISEGKEWNSFRPDVAFSGSVCV